MTNDKAYCIRSNKFMEKPCTNTNCDRHEKMSQLMAVITGSGLILTNVMITELRTLKLFVVLETVLIVLQQ